MLEEMEVAEELDEALVVLNVLQLYFSQGLNANLAVDSENHLCFDHFFLGRNQTCVVMACGVTRLLGALLHCRGLSALKLRFLPGHVGLGFYKFGYLVVNVMKGNSGFAALLAANEHFHF